MWLGKNESSRGVIRGVAHAHHTIDSVLELVHLFRVFVTLLMQYEPARELISSSVESSGLSHSFITRKPHKLLWWRCNPPPTPIFFYRSTRFTWITYFKVKTANFTERWQVCTPEWSQCMKLRRKLKRLFNWQKQSRHLKTILNCHWKKWERVNLSKLR